MPVGHDIVRALAALWASRAAGMVLNLALVPVLFRALTPDELAVWLLMGQAGAAVALLDFGLTSVLIRRVAMASTPDDAAALLATARPLYRGLAVLAGIGSAVAGWWLLAGVGLDPGELLRARAAWTAVCLGNAYALYRGLWTAAATGAGLVAAVAARGAGIGVGVTLLQGAALALGGGVEALAAVALAGSLAYGAALSRLLAIHAPALANPSALPCPALRRSLLAASGRYWLTELGALALLRTDQLFLAGFGQLQDIPAYYAAYSMLYTMALASIALAEAAGVFVSRAWRADDPAHVHLLVLRSLRIGLALMLCGAAVMATVGDAVVGVWAGPGRFVGWPVLLTFCAMLALFVQQSLLLGFSRATEHEAYAPVFLLAGALNLGITWALAAPLGVLGVALGTLVSQALTTSWFVPRSALRRLGIPWRTYAATVLGPALLTGAAAGGAAMAAGACAGAPWARVMLGGAAGGLAMLAAGWVLVLDPGLRHDVRRGAGAAWRVAWRGMARAV